MASSRTRAPAADPAEAGPSAPAGAATGVDEELAARLRVAVTRLNRRLRQESAGGLTPSQLSTLGSISRLGNPTLGELAQAEQVQPPTITRTVAAMESAGLVARQGDESDRRVSRVALTEEGQSTLSRVRSLKTAFLIRQLGRLGPDELASAAALTALLERMLEDR